MRRSVTQTLLLPVVLFFHLTVHGQMSGAVKASPHPVFPGFGEVTKTFFSRYNYGGPPGLLQFQKKKEGWYTAVLEDQLSGESHDGSLFWSAEQGKYLPQNYPANADSSQSVLAETIKSYYSDIGYESWTAYTYAHCVYFGYSGWDRDIIKDFGQAPNLDDSLLEGLGRAYSNYAIGFLYDQYGFSWRGDDPDRKKLPPGQALGESRKNKFIATETRAIATFQRLARQNPAYQTRIGNSQIKYADECLFTFSTLRYIGYPAEARQFLRPGIYPDSLLQLARHYLDSVEKGSILITGGDNDTYALWYLQETENYRRDVIVLNYSLLGLQQFLAWLDKENKGSLFATRSSDYLRRNFDYAVFVEGGKGASPQPLAAFLDSVNASIPPAKPGENETDPMPDLNTIRKYYGKDLFIGPVKFHLGNMLLSSDFMLLDILNTNWHKHRLYFTTQDISTLFTPYLRPSGTVYEVREGG